MLAPDNGVRLALRNGHKSEHALTAVVALSQSISQLFSHFKFDFLARCPLLLSECCTPAPVSLPMHSYPGESCWCWAACVC